MTIKWVKDEQGNDWCVDTDNNKCSVKYFGDKERAEKALKSLKNCENCVNCSDCSDCSDCSRCSDWKNNQPPVKWSGNIPIIENIHQKVLEAVSQPDALDMNSWHTCETTHCRAGWVVTLAGKDGKALEQFHDTPLAALLIYNASSPFKVSMPRFYENNEVAMADMVRLVELEKNAE